MKKILALVIAVVMLAALAVPASATPATSEGQVIFLFGDISQVPTQRVFCPVAHAPGGAGAWTGDLVGGVGFASWGVNFGNRALPAAGSTAAIVANTDGLAPENRTRADRFLAIGVQAWIDDPGPPAIMMTGNWHLQGQLSQFFTGGTWTNAVNAGGVLRMQEWSISLAAPQGPDHTAATGLHVRPQWRFPTNATAPTLLAPNFPAGGATPVNVTSPGTPAQAVFFMEFLPSLNPPTAGGVNLMNMPPHGVTAQAVMTWTYNPL